MPIYSDRDLVGTIFKWDQFACVREGTPNTPSLERKMYWADDGDERRLIVPNPKREDNYGLVLYGNLEILAPGWFPSREFRATAMLDYGGATHKTITWNDLVNVTYDYIRDERWTINTEVAWNGSFFCMALSNVVGAVAYELKWQPSSGCTFNFDLSSPPGGNYAAIAIDDTRSFVN